MKFNDADFLIWELKNLAEEHIRYQPKTLTPLFKWQLERLQEIALEFDKVWKQVRK